MILKNHTTIDKLMLETAKDPSDLIDYVTKNMKHNLVEEVLNKIEPGKDYLIKLHGADYYEEVGKFICGYKMALEVYGWTPCSERLPKHDEFVLVSGEIDGMTRFFISRGINLIYLVDADEKTGLAWMPLPEPYKEK